MHAALRDVACHKGNKSHIAGMHVCCCTCTSYVEHYKKSGLETRWSASRRTILRAKPAADLRRVFLLSLNAMIAGPAFRREEPTQNQRIFQELSRLPHQGLNLAKRGCLRRQRSALLEPALHGRSFRDLAAVFGYMAGVKSRGGSLPGYLLTGQMQPLLTRY